MDIERQIWEQFSLFSKTSFFIILLNITEWDFFEKLEEEKVKSKFQTQLYAR